MSIFQTAQARSGASLGASLTTSTYPVASLPPDLLRPQAPVPDPQRRRGAEGLERARCRTFGRSAPYSSAKRW